MLFLWLVNTFNCLFHRCPFSYYYIIYIYIYISAGLTTVLLLLVFWGGGMDVCTVRGGGGGCWRWNINKDNNLAEENKNALSRMFFQFQKNHCLLCIMYFCFFLCIHPIHILIWCCDTSRSYWWSTPPSVLRWRSLSSSTSARSMAFRRWWVFSTTLTPSMTTREPGRWRSGSKTDFGQRSIR